MNERSDKILDGRAASAAIKVDLKGRVDALRARGVVPGLATLLVGDDPASKIYVNNKHKACTEIGIASMHETMPASTTEAALLDRIEALNADPAVHGILVQLPLPAGIDPERVLFAIDPAKDVDGFHPVNLGKLVRGTIDDGFVSCTPAGIIHLLTVHGGLDLKGLDAVIVNRSNIVGKPLVHLLLKENATVTVCHTGTRDLAAHVCRADLLVAGVGKPKFFTSAHVKPGAIVVDVGMNRGPDGLCGDVDFDDVLPVASKITPVPGGVGLMTVAMLLANTVTAAERSTPPRGRPGP